MEFSLLYFSEMGQQLNPINILLETAKFTDQHGFQRYGLLNVIFTLGAVETYEKKIGVDEINLTDFGLDFDSIIASLYHLKDLKEEYQNKKTVRQYSALSFFG